MRFDSITQIFPSRLNLTTHEFFSSGILHPQQTPAWIENFGVGDSSGPRVRVRDREIRGLLDGWTRHEHGDLRLLTQSGREGLRRCLNLGSRGFD